MTREAVVTGIGLVLPNVTSADQLWKIAIEEVATRDDRSDEATPMTIDPSLISDALPTRLAKKLDAFTQYALIATQSALSDAGLNLDQYNRERCGVFVGNCFGGWRFTENELRRLHCEGPRAVSPFQATSWFPAAPQGQITIAHGIRGFSKTYMADRMSSLVSIAAAARLVRSGELDIAIAGGTESTNTDFVRAALGNIPALNGEGAASVSDFKISEGAVFLVIEEASHAQARGARIYSKIGAFAMRTSACPPDRYGTESNVLRSAMSQVLGNRQPTFVVPDASGLRRVDASEEAAITAICPDAQVLKPKRRLGHTFGAEGALDVAVASLMLQRQAVLPKAIDCREVTASRLHRIPKAIDSVIVNSSAMGGSSSSIMLEKGI